MINNFKEILDHIVKTEDNEKMIILQEMMEDLLEESKEKKKYEMDLYKLAYGPHFNDEKLKESGVKIKYSTPEIEKLISAHGIKFPECVTMEDVTYTTNYLYHLYYPLIPDISVALRFTEKYIKDETYPVKYGRAFCDWSHREWLREKHSKK
jgi:hypothetical protein